MKAWNTHAWYVTGILLALLIGSISVQWAGIKDLAGVVSFALGLASLLLALIAIVQVITSSGSAEHSLGAIRETASELGTLASSINDGTIRLESVVHSVLETNNQNRDELVALRDEVLAKNISAQENINDASSENNPESPFEREKLTYGPALAIYTFLRALQAEKEFVINDIKFELEESANNMHKLFFSSVISGILSGIRTVGVFEYNRDGQVICPKSAKCDIDKSINELRSLKFQEKSDDRYKATIKNIDAYFV